MIPASPFSPAAQTGLALKQSILNGRTDPSILKKSNASPFSCAFFAALNDCGSTSNHLHPVHARNLGLESTWQRWVSGRADKPDDALADTSIRWQQNIDMMEYLMHADPDCQQGRIKLPAHPLDLHAAAANVTAPLMYWRWPHTLFELTPVLEQLLMRSDLGDDIPCDLLRPPVPACYIRFGAELQQSIVPLHANGFAYESIEGVYVFEATDGPMRAITLAPVYVHADQTKVSVGTIEMLTRDNEKRPLVDLIQCICEKDPIETWPHYQSVAQLCIKVFLYLSLAQTQRVEENPYTEAMTQLRRIGPKKAAKVRRQVSKLYDRILLGPLTLPVHADGEHSEVSPHWRRGHFRMQPYGPQSALRKMIFVAPTCIRADRLKA